MYKIGTIYLFVLQFCRRRGCLVVAKNIGLSEQHRRIAMMCMSSPGSPTCERITAVKHL